MRVGRLRKRVMVKRRTAVDDGQGGKTYAWELIRNTWASIEPVSAREYFEAQTNNETITHRVRMRYGIDVQSLDWIVYGNRTFVVKAPPRNVGETNHWLELVCEEVRV